MYIFHWNLVLQKHITIIHVSLHTLITGPGPASFTFTHLYISSFIHALIYLWKSIYTQKVWTPVIKTPEYSELLLYTHFHKEKKEKATFKWWTSELQMALIKSFDSDTLQSHHWSRLGTLFLCYLYLHFPMSHRLPRTGSLI